MKLLCRNSYEQAARSPFDNPLSSRFDENDAVLLFDRAVIPWENVLVYRDVERANSFYRFSAFLNRYNLQAAVRLAVKLDFMAALFARAITSNGTNEFRGVQVAHGQLLALRHLVWGMTTAMVLDPEPGPGGSVVPKLEYAAAMRAFGPETWDTVRSTFESFLGGSPIVIPSSVADLRNEELQPLIERFYRGSDRTAVERIKLFKLIWDAVGSEFGGRHGFYERNYAGNYDQIRLDVVNFSRARGTLSAADALVERCLSDYDPDGWTSDTWV
jgi:aromatic ring hydroxylase